MIDMSESVGFGVCILRFQHYWAGFVFFLVERVAMGKSCLWDGKMGKKSVALEGMFLCVLNLGNNN